MSGADAKGARFARFLEAGGVEAADERGRRLQDVLFASGSLLPDLLIGDVSLWPALLADPWLERQKPAAVAFEEAEQATRGAVDFDDFKRRLRLYRRREILRLGARELGWGTTEEVAAELSGFADACVELAYRFCDGELRQELGQPEGDSEGRGAGAGARRRRAVVRGDGDGEARRAGAELLVRHRRHLLLCHGRRPGRAAGRAGPAARRAAHPAWLLLGAVTSDHRGDRGGHAGGVGLPRRSAPAARRTQRAAREFRGGGRALLRDVRADLGAAGAAAGEALRRGSPARRSSCSRSWTRSSIPGTSLRR